MLEESKYLDMLMQALHLLAAPYEQQIKTLPDFVHIPDEIALIFDDVYTLVNQQMEEIFITDAQQAMLKQIDAQLEKMSKKKDVWSLNALEASFQWEDIRSLAKKLLLSFHETEQLPDLFWIHYLKDEQPRHDLP